MGEISQMVFNTETYNILKLTVNKPINFHGFGILGRTVESLPEYLTIKLQDSNGTDLLESVIVNNHCDGSEKTYDLIFDKSMLLKPNEVYAASFLRENPAKLGNHYLVDYNSIGKGDSDSYGVLFNIKSYKFK